MNTHHLLIILVPILAMMAGVYNGFFLKFNDAQTTEEKKLAGTQFHGYGAILRAVFVLLWLPFIGVWSWLDWAFWLSVYLWTAFVLYDGMCNLLRPHLPGNLFQKFFYSGSVTSGTTSIIDILLGRWLPMIKVAFTALEVFFVLYYIFM